MKQLCELGGEEGYILGDYYFRSRKGLDMSDAKYPNRVLLIETFVENKTEYLYNQLNMYRYMVPLNTY